MAAALRVGSWVCRRLHSPAPPRQPAPRRQNEADVAAALQQAAVPRDDVLVTSKLSPFQHGTAAATAAVADIVARLGGRVDSLLIHWPGVARLDAASPDNAALRLQTWRVLEGLYRAGAVRAIGVSNYSVAHLAELLAVAEVPPHINQVRGRPGGARVCSVLRLPRGS